MVFPRTGSGKKRRNPYGRPLAAVRARMIDYIWQGEGMPTNGVDSVTRDTTEIGGPYSDIDHYDIIDMTLPIDGFTSRGILAYPEGTPSEWLLIYHPGHAEHFLADTALTNIWHPLMRDHRYHVLTMSMPLAGPNPMNFTSNGVSITGDHDSLQGLEDLDLPTLRLFLDPVIRAINWARDEGFTKIAMLGLSGGGWTTHFSAALDTRITKSYAWAGSLPHTFTAYDGSRDYEQDAVHPVYDIADFPTIYSLAAFGGRRHVQGLNLNDEIYPAAGNTTAIAAYEARVRDNLRGDPGASFAVYTDSSVHADPQHVISPTAREWIAADING